MGRMTIDQLRDTARLAGFDWSDETLAGILPAVQSVLDSLAVLERSELGGVEPAAQYRVL